MELSEKTAGTLYICPTPIGNLKDVTLRVLEVLESVDLIACEDTRDSGKFLSHYDIHTSLTSYHEHNRSSKGEKLVDILLSGKNIALISDAGMPGISDPGEDLIKQCIEYGIEYTVLPGASAGITALVGSGKSTKRFVFEGFLPKKGKERKERIEDIAKESRTIILYESPHGLKTTLKDLEKLMGNRKITITRELTKVFEEKVYTTVSEGVKFFEEKDPRGEFVLVIEGRSKEEALSESIKKYENLSVEEHLKIYEDAGMKKNEAMKCVAKDLGKTKRDIYNMLLEEKE